MGSFIGPRFSFSCDKSSFGWGYIAPRVTCDRGCCSARVFRIFHHSRTRRRRLRAVSVSRPVATIFPTWRCSYRYGHVSCNAQLSPVKEQAAHSRASDRPVWDGVKRQATMRGVQRSAKALVHSKGDNAKLTKWPKAGKLHPLPRHNPITRENPVFCQTQVVQCSCFLVI